MTGDRNGPPGHGRQDLDRRLVTVAREILEQDGLEALTLRAAARRAGVSHMAPYRHFESKDDLLAAVAAQGFEGLKHAMDRATAGAITPQAKLDDLGVAYVSFAISTPALYRLMFGANLPNRSRFPGLVSAGAEAFQCCIGVIDPGTKRAPQNNEPARCSPKAIAFWALVHGLACLAIDELVYLPAKGDGALGEEIEKLLKEANFSVAA